MSVNQSFKESVTDGDSHLRFHYHFFWGFCILFNNKSILYEQYYSKLRGQENKSKIKEKHVNLFY